MQITIFFIANKNIDFDHMCHIILWTIWKMYN